MQRGWDLVVADGQYNEFVVGKQMFFHGFNEVDAVDLRAIERFIVHRTE